MPAPPYSLHQPALHDRRPANICGCCFAARPADICGCCFAARPTNFIVCSSCYYKACAGRIVRRLCSPAAALFCRLCVPARLCHAMPTALLIVCPRSVLLCPHLFISMCAGIVVEVVRTVLLAATTRACSGGPSDGFGLSFPAESIDPGPWLV